MPRTKVEIEAEIESMKASGVHHASAPMRALREELKALDAPAPVAASPATGTVSTAVAGWTAPATECSPLQSDEWRFIEKCLAETEIDFAAGNTTGACKKMFHAIKARVQIWRVLRDVTLKFGEGAKWPEWPSLNLNDATGEPKAEKPAAPVVIPPAGPAMGVTEGGMPIRSRAPASELDALANAIRGSVSAEVSPA